ncbi:DUF4012 domain-containing protein, partial [Candidatus Berkelbacteria bacterium]|nr:DUF4012 domain-containing protein [Candidatus Berkelbacteria bacterium]
MSIAQDASIVGSRLSEMLALSGELLQTSSREVSSEVSWQESLSRLLSVLTKVVGDKAVLLVEAASAAQRLEHNLVLVHDPRAVEVGRVRAGLRAVSTVAAELPNLLGKPEPRSYLILFQNNAELRPSGGFLGSFATATFSQGRLDKVEVNTNIYKLDKAFAKVSTVTPPRVLAETLHIKSLTLRDSNFALDPPKAADDVAAFYQAETGGRVDGVLAIDTTLVTDLLKVIGPIEMPAYEAKSDAQNFTTTLAHE